MPLNATSAARSIMDGLNNMSGKLNDLGDIPITAEEIAALPKNFAEVWAVSYDEYATAAVIPGATIYTSDPTIISSWFTANINGAFGSNYSAILPSFAQMFADYWATVYVGADQADSAPVHGGMEVVEATNNALSKQPAFEAAIRSIITQSIATPYMRPLLDAVEEVALTIQWTVTEIVMDPGPTPKRFTETIT